MTPSLLTLRNTLSRVQRDEPHHRRIGVATGGHSRPPSLEQVCRRCPSRKTCGAASEILAAAETERFSM